MTAMKILLAGGAALAALVSAAPASAQYYPGYGGGGVDIIGQVIGGMIGGGSGYGSPGYGYGSPYGGYGSPYGGSAYGGGYGSPYGYGGRYGSPYGSGYGSPFGGGRSAGGVNQYAVGQCMGAVQQKLNASYGQSQYGGPRVLGVSDVEQRSNGGTLVSGVANSGRTVASGYSNNGQPPVDLTFTCKTDRSGNIASIDLGQATATANYGYQGGYGTVPAAPYNGDYAQYGYRRY